MMSIRRKSATAALFAGMLIGATSVASPAAAVVPSTLLNSAPNLSIFVPQKGGIYVGGALFSIGIPTNTTLQTSTAAWVNPANNTIVIPKLPTVAGTVSAKDIDPRGSIFSVTADKTYRYFKGNGLPSTPMGKFGPQPGTAAYPYYAGAPGGVNTQPGSPGFGQPYSSAAAIGISPYNLEIKVPLAPQYLPTPQPIQYLITGVTLTGTVWHAEIANASSSAWYNPISILPLDQCFGHPYSQQYHLHAYSWKCLPNQGIIGQSPLLGYALDGFGIYGPRGADGKEITNAQLDECHGMTSPVLWNGKVQNVYHYVLNSEYPYSVGCFRGAIDPANVSNNFFPTLGQPMNMPGMPGMPGMQGMGH